MVVAAEDNAFTAAGTAELDAEYRFSVFPASYRPGFSVGTDQTPATLIESGPLLSANIQAEVDIGNEEGRAALQRMRIATQPLSLLRVERHWFDPNDPENRTPRHILELRGGKFGFLHDQDNLAGILQNAAAFDCEFRYEFATQVPSSGPGQMTDVGFQVSGCPLRYLLGSLKTEDNENIAAFAPTLNLGVTLGSEGVAQAAFRAFGDFQFLFGGEEEKSSDRRAAILKPGVEIAVEKIADSPMGIKATYEPTIQLKETGSDGPWEAERVDRMMLKAVGAF